MYPVTTQYKNKIQELERVFKATIQIQHSTGVLDLIDKDIVGGSMIYTEGSQAGEEFTVGGTVASDFTIEIMNKPEYENINFMGATIIPTIGLLLKDGQDTETYFLSAPFPSEFVKGEGQELWENVPLGRFNIDDVNRQRNTIKLKAIDNMIELDKPYSLSKLSYPATLYQIYVNICNACDVQIGTTNFPNKNHRVNIKPEENLTFRDILGYVAELSGTFARMNRTGALELIWYKSSGITLTGANRFDFKASDDVVRIKGIMATVDDTTYLAGSDDYAIDLTDNPLLQDGYETVLPNIFNNVKDTVFTPYTSSWQGNMAIQAGDMITQIDRDEKVYNTLITKSIYKYRGKSSIEGKGLSEISKGYQGSTNKKIANIVKKVEKEVIDKITTLEQLQLNATEMIANMLGGHLIEDRENGAIYIADNPNIGLAMKVWKWGIGGFGYSSTGKDGPYNTAITADGTIVAMLVAANIITADMVQTGMLQSEDGSTWINLDDGTFNFKNALRWQDNQLIVQSPSIPDLSSVNKKISNIENLRPGTLQGGIVTVNNQRVRVEHGDSNQYSEIRADGFVRKHRYGEARYLNDIYVEVYKNINHGIQETPIPPVRITLPRSFQGREDNIKVLLSVTKFRPIIGTLSENGNVIGLTSEFEVILEVTSQNFDTSLPYVDVTSYLRQEFRYSSTGWETDYTPVDFMLMVVGS